MCCCRFGRVFNSVFVRSCGANAAVPETKWWRVTWESRLPATPPPLLCPTQEKLFLHKTETVSNGCRIREAHGNNVQIKKCSSPSNPKQKTVSISPNCQTTGEQNENRPQETSSPSQRKPSKKHQKLTHSMYPLLNQALRHEE